MGQIADTNAQEAGKMLPSIGIAHHYRQTVGDNLGRVTEAIELALRRSDIVITIGGLGPTEDDLTREAIAAAIGAELVDHPEIGEKIRRLFAQRNIPWTERQLKQGLVPAGGSPIDNPNGTAPGLLCPVGPKVVIAMPGPRGEFIPMLEGPVREYLRDQFGEGVIVAHYFRISRMGESMVEEALADLMQGENPSLAPYASPGEVTLRLTARAKSEEQAQALLEPVAAEIRSRLGDNIFAEGDDNLETTIVKLLTHRKYSVSTAESITGGNVSARLTSVPGSSPVVRGAVVAYQVEIKETVLGIDPEIAKDPVSEEVAFALADRARAIFGSDFALSLTGNAGPTSDEGGKPVGLVYIGISTPDETRVERFQFRGTREDIRRRSEQSALTMLRDAILAYGQ